MRNPRYFTPALRLLALGVALLGANQAHAAGEPNVPALNWHPCPEYPGYGYKCRSDCVTRHVDAYLLRGTLPKKCTVCPANPNPFEQAALQISAPSRPAVSRPPPGWPGWPGWRA
jgi:hypothetical protein